MLKGFIVIFTALISYFMFKKRMTSFQIIGVIGVLVGLLLVGLSNIYAYNPKFAPKPFLGNLLVIFGQFFLAAMFVYEEKILKEYDVHVLEIVGWEGLWGMMLSGIFLCVTYFLPGNDLGSYENPVQATIQIINSPWLFGAVLCSTLIIGPFNYYGTNLTKLSSAMHRCLIDASRMCVVWLASICCGWESFKMQQVCGYICVIAGNLIFYEILKFEARTDTSQKDDENRIPTAPESKSEEGFLINMIGRITEFLLKQKSKDKNEPEEKIKIHRIQTEEENLTERK